MAVEGVAGSELVKVVALLGAAVVMVPVFRRLGLGSVLGYLSAGLLIGPFGLGWFSDPQAILHVAELGVVMFLFVIGLEMRPSHLWSLRREIFGLGALQIATCTAVLTGVAMLCGLPPQTGLYCYLLAGLGYAIFGSSRHLAVGPTSAISLLLGVTLAGLAACTTTPRRPAPPGGATAATAPTPGSRGTGPS